MYPDLIKNKFRDSFGICRGFLQKYRYIFLLLPLFFILPPVLIETGFRSLTKTADLENRIEELNKGNALSISYDGYNLGFFSGIVLFNVKIALEIDNLKSPTLISMPELVLKPDLIGSIQKKQPVIKSIVFKDARWEINASSDETRSLLDANIRKILTSQKDFQIFLDNNTLSLTFEKKTYEREKWNIKIKKGYISSDKNGIAVRLRYNDSPWGKGNLLFKPELCENCSLISGNYQGNFKDFPVNRLSWFFKDYKLKDGFISADFSLNLLSRKDTLEYSTQSSIKFTDPDITSLENKPVLDFKKFSADFKLENKNNVFKSEFQGKINESEFKGSLEQKEKSHLPEKFALTLENKGKYAFPLYYGYKIKGLNYISLNIEEKPENKNVYREISGKVSIKEGNISAIDSDFLVGIPDAELTIDKNDFSGIIRCEKGKSDLKFSFSGKFAPVLKKISTQLEFEDYLRNRPIDIDSVIWNISEEGTLEGNNLYWSDLKDIYEAISKKWVKSIYNDAYKGWRPSILREREWFQSYLMYGSYQNKIAIKNWDLEKKSQESAESPLEGNFSFNGTQFESAFTSGDNKLDFKIDASSSYPLMRGEFSYDFKSPSDFSNLWLPPKFGSSYTGFKINASFYTSGEKPVEINNNFNGSYDYKFFDFRLPPEMDQENRNWDTLEIGLRRFGTKFNINYQGENDSQFLKGWGSLDENENAEWKVNSSTANKIRPVN